MRFAGKLSVAVPVYNEESVLPELYRRLSRVLEESSESYELVFVDDGSTDGSLEWLAALANINPSVRVVALSRETCYKAFRREVIRGLKLRQNRFGFEPEITARLARRQVRIVETPVRYNARDYAEGKKIGIRDAFNALYCIVRYGMAE